MKIYDFYFGNKYVNSYAANNKKSAVLMAKGNKIKFDKVLIDQTIRKDDLNGNK